MNLKQVSVVVSVVVLSSCTRHVPVLPAAAPLLPTAVCDHGFTVAQQNLQPSFVEKETNSIIEGDTLEGLVRSLTSTTEYQGKGNTKWTISWSYDSRRSAVSCAIENVETSVDIVYHLPLWPEQLTVANRTLADQWTQYSDALRAHHCEHGKTGIEAAIEVKSRLQQLAGFRSCDALIQEADSLARSVISVYKQAEAALVPPQMFDYLKDSK